jgi:ribonuclease D
VQDAELITRIERLEQLATQLLSAAAVAVDTEFFWERTFYPILGLVQLATAEGCWLVDTVRIQNIRALGPVLASPSIMKILHDAPQDLGILARTTGARPQNIFDTRLAAGFAGFGATCSLQMLLRETLGVEISKAETRSDWLRRPLSQNQLRYAAVDVLHLIACRDILLSRCASDTVRGWLAEDLAQLNDPGTYQERDPRLMYLRVKGCSRLPARPLAVLRELAAWREQEARARDWPRAHVLPDDLLVALAVRSPADRAAFNDVQGLPRTLPDTIVTDMLAAVARGLSLPEAEFPQPAANDDFSSKRALKPETDRLLAHIAAACAPHRVDPARVAARADAEAYLRLSQGAASDHPLAHGWRRTLVADFARTNEQLRLL